MKTLRNIAITRNGQAVVDGDSKEPMTLLSVCKVVLDNTQYENRSQLRTADKLYAKLEEADKAEEFALEDAEFEVIYNHANKYKPILAGRTFVQMFDELERAQSEK